MFIPGRSMYCKHRSVVQKMILVILIYFWLITKQVLWSYMLIIFKVIYGSSGKRCTWCGFRTHEFWISVLYMYLLWSSWANQATDLQVIPGLSTLWSYTVDPSFLMESRSPWASIFHFISSLQRSTFWAPCQGATSCYHFLSSLYQTCNLLPSKQTLLLS